MPKLIVIAPKLIKVLSANFASAMALYPFILLKDKNALENNVLLNHESIHLRQQIEMLIIPFYLWYGIEYLVLRIKYKSHYVAYRHISFEREAYAKQHEPDYLKSRKFWSFLFYIK